MNLTSKRILQCLTVVASVFAFTATAEGPTRWVEDSFESPNGANGMLISEYKAADPDVDGISNYLWVAEADDLSKITTNDSARAGYGGTTEPIDGGTGELVLALETEGGILSRHVINGSSTGKTFSAVAPVYVDTLIKFTPSEDPPTISNDVKMAVYVNENTNLVVYHGMYVNYLLTSTNSVIDNIGPISPEQWHRLTICLGQPTEELYADAPAFQIFLDGTVLTDENSTANNWFLTATVGGGDQFDLKAVAFQGTGFVDELVVSDAVDFGTSAAILLTLSYDTGINTVTTNGAAVANGGTVPNGAFIEIDAKDWYNVTAVDGATFADPGEVGYNSASGTVTAAVSTNVTIASATYTGTGSMGGNSVNAAKLSAWAIANSKSESDVAANAADWFDEYLLNLPAADGVTNTISIASITVGATEATIKVVASSTAVDFANINGTLNIYTATNLVTGFGNDPVTQDVVFTESQNTNTVTVPLTAGSFIKATVK